jgi:hypothetical protein
MRMVEAPRPARLIGALALAALLAPHLATADHTCNSDLSVLSRVAAEEPALNPHELAVCPTGGDVDDVYDTRTIQPGANQIQIVYAPTPAPGPGSPAVTASVAGLTSGTYQLVPSQVVTGIYRYASAWISIPAGEPGSVTVSVPGDTTTYHTVN